MKTQQVTKSRGKEEIELAAYLANAACPVPLVLDVRLAHYHIGSSSVLTLVSMDTYDNDLDGQ